MTVRRCALLVLVLAVRAHAQPWLCTELVGFSQTGQWENTFAFRSQVDGSVWQNRIAGSAWLGAIASPGWDGWRGTASSPCVFGATRPHRIVLTATMDRFADTPQAILPYLRSAVATIRARYPYGPTIVLQPVVGGPNDQRCYMAAGNPSTRVRAAWNHPVIDEAIELLLAEQPDDVVDLQAGFSPEVASCGQYRDTTGHLTATGAEHAGRTIGRWFLGAAGSTTSSTTVPSSSTSTTMPPLGCKTEGQGCDPAGIRDRCCQPTTCTDVPHAEPRFRCR